MSTFGGWMPEFPDIRVDYFRTIAGVRPPLACFLSHVHSDHLHGLESLKAPFIYCSAASKEILIRLERYPHRINFQLGILESRKQHYKHLKTLLRPIPLETPTTIELAPGNEIQVTLFDANHCTGAVMFLIEGGGNAVLYTGDIRSEPWFVNNLRRNPILIEYTSGLKTLDCIYLDTSFTDRVRFPTKADGITELVQKVAKYPPETIFHFTAWTYGYEEVWLALSRALKSKIHVDEYKMRIYQSLRGNGLGQHLAPEGPTLAGFKVGNHNHDGILTLDQDVRIHSCEKGTECLCNVANNKTVWIRPIITRINGQEIGEIGIGGGGEDLTGRPELELDSEAAIRQLLAMFLNVSSPVKSEVKSILETALHSTGKALSLDDLGLDLEDNELSLENLLTILTRSAVQKAEQKQSRLQPKGLPKFITFPYSRHSSFFELRDLIDAFRPLDVYPCTVDEKRWDEDVSISELFGNLCTGDVFRHDVEMRRLQRGVQHLSPNSQLSHSSANASYLSQDQPDGVEEVFPPTHPLDGISSLPAGNPPGDDSIMNLPVSVCSRTMSLERDSRGRLRLIPRLVLRSEGLEPTSTTQTKDLFATSSPSKMQGIRRKAISDDNGNNKKAKFHSIKDSVENELQYSGTCNKHVDKLQPSFSGSLLALENWPVSSRAVSESSADHYDQSGSPASDNTSGGLVAADNGPGDWSSDDDMSYFQFGKKTTNSVEKDDICDISPEKHHQGDDIRNDTKQGALDDFFYFDHYDNIYRCVTCHWECWAQYPHCTTCEQGASKYFKVLDPNRKRADELPDDLGSDFELPDDSKTLPQSENDSSDDDIIMNYQDDPPANSDHTDSEPDEYEMDSFIDDTSVNDAPNGDDSSDDTEADDIDYQALFQQSCEEYAALEEDYFNLIGVHEDLRRDVLGSEYDSLDGSEDIDGIFPVDVQVKDPPVSEMDGSFEGQVDSQSSVISNEMVLVGDHALAAAPGTHGQQWHNVSLISTADNHTSADLEL